MSLLSLKRPQVFACTLNPLSTLPVDGRQVPTLNRVGCPEPSHSHLRNRAGMPYRCMQLSADQQGKLP